MNIFSWSGSCFYFWRSSLGGGRFFASCKLYLRHFFVSSIFFLGWTAGVACPLYTDTGGKILRLQVAEKQIRDKSRHSKRDLCLGRVECRLTFCFSATRNLYTDFFQQCLYIKDTPFPLYSFGKIYFIEKKEVPGIEIVCWCKKPATTRRAPRVKKTATPWKWIRESGSWMAFYLVILRLLFGSDFFEGFGNFFFRSRCKQAYNHIHNDCYNESRK